MLSEVADAVPIESESGVFASGSVVSAPAGEASVDIASADPELRQAYNSVSDDLLPKTAGGDAPTANPGDSATFASSTASASSATETIGAETQFLSNGCPNGQCKDQLPIIGHAGSSAVDDMNNCFEASGNDSTNCDQDFSVIPTDEAKTIWNKATGGILDKIDAANNALRNLGSWWNGGTQQPAEPANDSQMECVNCRAPQGRPYEPNN